MRTRDEAPSRTREAIDRSHVFVRPVVVPYVRKNAPSPWQHIGNGARKRSIAPAE